MADETRRFSSIASMLAVSILLLPVLAVDVIAAPDGKAASKAAAARLVNMPAVPWYEGDRKRRAWLNPSLVADFSSGPAADSPVLDYDAGATLHEQHPSMRLWRLHRTLEPGALPLQVSPVLHDSRSETARMRTLPGNIIVYLDRNMSAAQAERRIRASGLEIVARPGFRPNTYILKTAAGMAALQAANSLFETGAVEAAFPDWWTQSTTR